MAKVVIIGAGSLGFSSKLTADILSYEATCDAEFALVDIDEKRLFYAEQIAKRIFQEGGYDGATVTATTDRRKALEGADYVIISILVGGYEAIEREIDIASTRPIAAIAVAPARMGPNSSASNKEKSVSGGSERGIWPRTATP